MIKKHHYIEYWIVLAFHGFCRLLPVRVASGFVGWLAAAIMPHLAVTRKAVRNIKNALDVDEATAQEISKGMWNNLGRIMAEFPHLQDISENRVVFQGKEHIKKLRDDGQCGILFGAHLGNWEVIPHALLTHFDFCMHPVYRAPNNKLVDKRLHRYRSPDGKLVPYSKSRKGMAGMVKALKSGEHLGMLIDQKYNEGIEADFFGMTAPTGTAFIELAQKYDCPLVPIRCIRNDCDFIIEALPPLETKNRPVESVLTEAHKILEDWIREYPEQWLWLHRRWRMES